MSKSFWENVWDFYEGNKHSAIFRLAYKNTSTLAALYRLVRLHAVPQERTLKSRDSRNHMKSNFDSLLQFFDVIHLSVLAAQLCSTGCDLFPGPALKSFLMTGSKDVSRRR